MRDDFFRDVGQQWHREIVSHAFNDGNPGIATALTDHVRRFQPAGHSHQRVFIAVHHQRGRLDLANRTGSVIAGGNREQLPGTSSRMIGAQDMPLADLSQVLGRRGMGTTADSGEHPHHPLDGTLRIAAL